MANSQQVLLHCCCAPCSSAIIEWMLNHDICPILYYCNPNIFPIEEYLIRKNECSAYAQKLGLEIIDDDYDHDSWLETTGKFAKEPERGPRCLLCFKYRLLRTAKKAAELGISKFCTTLASSRWKSLDQINEAGFWAASIVSQELNVSLTFDDRNWRKGGLQQRRNELLRLNGFYNQLYCGCEFSLSAMRRRHLPEVSSTNTWMLDTLSRGVEMVDETVVYTMNQTAGRGQVGNVWESEPNKNIAFSMLLTPTFVPIREQFVISELCSLGVVEGIKKLLLEKQASCIADSLSIKWPNDIYVGDMKLGGILIENRLQGNVFANAVLGVGININQERWTGSAPNPISLKLLAVDSSPQEVLEYIVEGITGLYHILRDNPKGAELLHDSYIQCLYRKEGLHPYVDSQSGERFDAKIADIDRHGPMVLELSTGEQRRYWFKEVKFVLPCGIIKE